MRTFFYNVTGIVGFVLFLVGIFYNIVPVLVTGITLIAIHLMMKPISHAHIIKKDLS